MIDICAKLNAFVRQKSLMGGSAAGDDKMLKCLETQRQICVKEATKKDKEKEAKEALEALKKIKSQYEHHLSTSTMSCRYSVQDDDVPKLIDQLCKLPMKGQEIKQAVDMDEKSRLRVIEEGKKGEVFILKGDGGVTSSLEGWKESLDVRH